MFGEQVLGEKILLGASRASIFALAGQFLCIPIANFCLFATLEKLTVEAQHRCGVLNGNG